MYCRAQPLDEPCSCGDRYHKQSHCPNHGNPNQNNSTQNPCFICQWCKSEANRTADERKDRLDYLQAMKANIEKVYDKYLWCFHCSAKDHKTSACTYDVAKFKCVI